MDLSPCQGDMSLYTEEAIKQRLQLRSDPVVIEAIKAWWRYRGGLKQRVQDAGIDDSIA